MRKRVGSHAQNSWPGRRLVRLRDDETGQDAVEYALIGGMVGLVTAIAAPTIYQRAGEILTTAAELLADAS